MKTPKKPTRRRLNVPTNPSQDLPDVAPGVQQDQTGRPGPSEPIGGQGANRDQVDPQKDNPTSFPGERPPGPSDMGKEPPPFKHTYEPDRDLHPALHPDFIPDGEPD